jgi:RNA polymerase sigma factor (sigma-70 family)
VTRSDAQFEELARNATPRLLGFVTRRVDSTADAADVVAEVLLIAWRRNDSLPDDENGALLWLFGAARRVIRNYHRGRVRRNALAERLRNELETAAVEEQAITSPAVRRALASLSEADRELILLHAWEGLSLVEAATVLGIRPAAARKRLERARSRVRAALEEGDANPLDSDGASTQPSVAQA